MSLNSFEYDGFEWWVDKAWLKDVLFVCVSGSHAYGWRTEKSDLDVRTVYFPDLAQAVSPFFKARTKQRTNKTGKKPIDFTEYPIHDFLVLVNKCNGNILDNLFEEKLYENKPLVKELQKIVLPNIHAGFISHCLGYYQHLKKDMENPTRLLKYGEQKLTLNAYKILLQGIVFVETKQYLYHLPTLLKKHCTKFGEEILSDYLSQKEPEKCEKARNELESLSKKLAKLKALPSSKTSAMNVLLDRFITKYYRGEQC